MTSNSQTTVTPPKASSAYRPDIDGLRAVAVLLVVVFHAFPEITWGGYVGVDIFFVISGFLITRILLTELDQAHFSFRHFYARRIKRIFPSLLVVLLFCYGFGVLFLLPDELTSLAKHIAGGAGSVANLVLWSESGYFDMDTERKPLLHLWSLGVEEQFYLLWPLLLFLAYQNKRRLLFYGFAGLFIISFLFNIIGVKTDPVGTFYSPHTRFWELMTGGLLASLSRAKINEIERPHLLGFKLPSLKGFPLTLPTLKNASAWLGLSLILIAALLLDKDSQFPGWWAVLPTFGAVLLIAAGSDAWLNKNLLTHPVMVFIGLISYPLYLWHWPLLAFARIMAMGQAPLELRAGLALASVLLAWLTYRFVEQPLRFGRNLHYKTMSLLVLMVTMGLAGYGHYSAQGLPFKGAEKTANEQFFDYYQTYPKTHNLMKYDRHDCNFYDTERNASKIDIDANCTTPHANQIVFVWGDSHAQHLNYGLSHILPPDVSLLQAGASGCPPSTTDFVPDRLQTCNRANRFVREKLATLKPDIVILAQQRGHSPARLDAVMDYLKNIGVKTVILVGPVPQWQEFLYKIILRKYWQLAGNRLNNYLDPKIIETDQLLKTHYQDTDAVRYISLTDTLCNEHGCLTFLNADRKDGLITYDYGHFTLPASDFVAHTILAPVLKQALQR